MARPRTHTIIYNVRFQAATKAYFNGKHGSEAAVADPEIYRAAA